MWLLDEDLDLSLPFFLSFHTSVFFPPVFIYPEMNDPQHENGKPATSVSKKNTSVVRNPKASDREFQRPHETWYYSSNHVLINRERMMRGIPPLMRSTIIDEVARNIAFAAATEVTCLDMTNDKEFLELKCDGTILRGTSIRAIHNKTMMGISKGRDRILQESYQQFGIGTCKSKNGVLFVVQIFSKTGRIEV
jgi:hypothetical protein